MTAFQCMVRGAVVAAGKFHLVILDLVSTFFWIGLSGFFFSLAIVWSSAKAVVTPDDLVALQSGVPSLTLLALGRVLLDHVELFSWAVGLAAVMSGSLWVLLEAFVRAGMCSSPSNGFLGNAVQKYLLFVVTGLIRRSVLFSAALFTALMTCGPLLAAPLGEWGRVWQEVRLPALTGAIVIFFLVFVLTILDTIVRGDALEEVGDQFWQVLRLVGTLVAFEGCLLVGSASLAVVAFLWSPWSEGLVGSVVLGAVLASALSLMHSYLLLVRYSSVDIMRRNP